MSTLVLSEMGQRIAYQKQFFDLRNISGQWGIYDTEKTNNKAPAGVSIEGHKTPQTQEWSICYVKMRLMTM